MDLHDYAPGTEVELKSWKGFDRDNQYIVEWSPGKVLQKNWENCFCGLKQPFHSHEVLIVGSEFGCSIIRQASHIRLADAPAANSSDGT